MVESFNHDEIQANSIKEGAGSQLSDLLRQEFLQKPGERRSNTGNAEQVLNFEKPLPGDSLVQRFDGTKDFLLASLDTASKRSNIAVANNGSWRLEA